MEQDKKSSDGNSSDKAPSTPPRPAERFEKKSKKNNQKLWVVKVILLTFSLTVVFSFLSDMTVSASTLVVAVFIVLLLIVISIIFDSIGIAVTSCEIAPILAMSARKMPGSKTALFLVKNADKVSSICGDVIGDICGIVSGACGVVIVSKILSVSASFNETILTILVSSTVAALTVGGKALGKKLAITHSKEFVLLTARIMSVFGEGKRK